MTVYGPMLVRSLRAELAEVDPFAVGGVTTQNLGAYLRTGCAGAHLDTDLYRAAHPVSRTDVMGRTFLNAYTDATR